MLNAILSGLLLVVLAVYVKLKKKDIFEPFILFALTILSTFFISSLQLSGMQQDYGKLALCFLAVMLGVFFVGNFIGTRLQQRHTTKAKIDKHKLVIAVYVLFVIVLASYLATWAIRGAPPLFSKADRSEYYVSGVGLLYMLIESLSFLIIYDLFGERNIKKKHAIIMLFVILFMILTTSNKFQLFYLIAQFVILYSLKKKQIRLKFYHFLIGGIAIVGIFALFYNVIYSGMYASTSDVYQAAEMRVPAKLSFLTEPYLYIAYNYDNIFHYITTTGSSVVGGGYFVLRKILSSIGLLSFIAPDYAALDAVWTKNLQHSWLTTGTVAKEFFLDFGWVGVFLGILILGLICGAAYKRARAEDADVFNAYLYTSLAVSLILSFLTNNFITTKFIFNIICMIIIKKFCTGRKKYEKK